VLHTRAYSDGERTGLSIYRDHPIGVGGRGPFSLERIETLSTPTDQIGPSY
jgi:hypothetical protein